MAKRSDDTLYKLPETDTVARDARNKLDNLLREAHSLRGVEQRLKEIKHELVELVQQHGLVSDGSLGTRCGDLCAVVRYTNGRESFNKELAVEAGITPEQIKAAMKRGEGYWVCELPRIGEEQQKNGLD